MTKPVILVCLLICLMAMVLVSESFGQDKFRCGSASYRRKFGVCGKRGIKRAPAAEFIDELNTRYGTPIYTLFFFIYKNILYKNVEDEISKMLRMY